jgi:hypothetical protein
MISTQEKETRKKLDEAYKDYFEKENLPYTERLLEEVKDATLEGYESSRAIKPGISIRR